jgi:DNA-binding NtrC family response regulator
VISQAVILIVNRDLGFVIWLGVTLAANGYATLPAGTSSAAQQLLDELLVAPDLAIANLEVGGTVELVEALRRADPALKVIAIEDATSITLPIAVDAAHSRSEDSWLATVERVLHLRNASDAS